jgi:hypothetical protein
VAKKLKSYLVRWEIELDATSARAAAEEALRIHRDPDSRACVFNVCPANSKAAVVVMQRIDLKDPT